MTELAKIQALFRAGVRVVTLHGLAGIGKTRLARAFADNEGIWCDLTLARDQTDICFVLAGELDTSMGGSRRLALLLGQILEARNVGLVVFDAAEGVVEALASVLGILQEPTKNTRYHVTSRETLRLADEAAVEVEPLGAADAHRLFVDRARLARPSFDASAHETAIDTIVRQLEGVPLALELAASRLGVMDIDTLLARLQTQLDVLSASFRGKGDRQRSLRGAFDSSFSMLSDEERRALVACTVFRGGFTLEAADAVLACPAADVLASLVSKSLVRRADDLRFGMYEVLRKLVADDPGDARNRHAAYYAASCSNWDATNWYGGTDDVKRLVVERHNLLYAHAHAAGSPDMLRLAIALYPVFACYGPYDAFLALLDEARDAKIAEASPPRLASRFYLVRGRGLQLCGRREEATACFEQSLRYARKAHESALAARALAYLGSARRAQGLMSEARERFDASAALFEEEGDSKSAAVVLSGLAALDLAEGNLDGAKATLERAITAVADPATAAMMQVDLGIVLQEMGDLEGAEQAYVAALTAHRAAGNLRHEGITLGYLGTLYDEQGRTDLAERSLTDAVEIVRSLGDRKFDAIFRAALAAVLAQRGQPDRAKELVHEAEELAREQGEARVVGAVALHALRVQGDTGARQGVAAGLAQQSDDVRFALRMLDRTLVPAPEAETSGVMLVDEAGAWAQLPSGKRIDLGRRAVHRRLLLRLVRERLASPSAYLPATALVAAGWPGEAVSPQSATNRLHVALAALRADGLRDILQREQSGYRLDPAVSIRVDR